MARRISARFSPGGPGNPPPAPKPQRAGVGAYLLFLAPLPMALRIPFQAPTSMGFSLIALGALLLGAWLTRDGVIAHKEYDLRPVARRPAIPRKIFGAVATGLGLAAATFTPGGEIAGSLVYAIAGIALHLTAFGPDPLSDKGMEGIEGVQSDRAARAIAEAEAHLAAIRTAIAPLNDRALHDLVARFQGSARAMFRRIENDPRDLTAARRYLGVYLQGARDATVKYVRLQDQGPNPAARAEYEVLLTDLDANFAARAQSLLRNDQTDLTVEIDVLRDRLRRDGLVTDRSGPAR